MQWASALWIENPILTKELRTRMRGTRAFWVLFAYLFILSVIQFVTYLSWWRSVSSGGYGGQAAFQIGKQFYNVLTVVQYLLVASITPALTAGGISIEKEQRTMDLLSISLLPRWAVVVGKQLSALSFVSLLLTSSLPLVSVSFLLGGVSPEEVLTTYVFLLATAFLLGSVGLACSAVAKNTTTATVMTYGLIITLLSGSLFLSSSNSLLRTVFGFFFADTNSDILYFGVKVPAWVFPFITQTFLGAIFLMTAVHRLDWPRSDRSGLLRLLVALFSALITLLWCATSGYPFAGAGMNPGSGTTDISSVAYFLFLGTGILLPIYATAEGLPPGRVLYNLINPRRLAFGEAPSGVAYLLIVCLLCLGIIALSLSFGTPTPAQGYSAQEYLFSLLVVGLIVLTFAWGSGTVGLLFSALTRNRWAAFVLTTSFLLIANLIPIFTIVARDVTNGENGSLWDNLAYFSPAMGLINYFADSNEFWSRLNTNLNTKVLLGGDTPFYIIVPIVYTVLGFLLLFVAERVSQHSEFRRIPNKGALVRERTIAHETTSPSDVR